MKKILFGSMLLVTLLILTGCGGSGGEETNTAPTPASPVGDITAPVPGTNIIFSSTAATGVTVAWGAASDNATAAANLQYKLVRSGTSISDVTAAEAATLVMDYTANKLSYSAVGLSATTTYHFAVIVKDEVGNKALYADQSVTTSSGTATLKGWELNENNTGLAGVGIDKNTLPDCNIPDKPAAGSTFSNCKIKKWVDLSNGNITIERCFIQPSMDNYTIPGSSYTNHGVAILHMDLDSPNPVIIRDCDIDGSLIPVEAGNNSIIAGGTIVRNHIYNTMNCISLVVKTPFNTLVENNYTHNQRAYGDPATGSHNAAFQIRVFGGAQAIIRNNRFETVIPGYSANVSSALAMQPSSGVIDNVLITGNLLVANGGYLLFLQDYTNIYGTNIRAINNRFTVDKGCYGSNVVILCHDSSCLTYNWAEWRDNYMDDPTQPDHKGAEVKVVTSHN